MVKLRDIKKMNSMNNGSRSIFESIAIPEVEQSLKQWKKNISDIGILIGGCAVSYFTRPRSTTDVDILYLNITDIPKEIDGFRKNRPGAFEHKQTGVEIEVLTPKSINLSDELSKKIDETKMFIDGMYVASPSGLVALKLQRLKRYDEGDIAALIETGKVDLSGWPLSDEQLEKFNEIKENNK